MKLNIDFSVYEFREPANNFRYFMLAVKLRVRNLIQSSAINPPLRYKQRSLFRNKRVGYKMLGSEIYFEDKEINVAMIQHVKRLRLYDTISGSIYFSIVFLGALGVSAAIPYFNTISAQFSYHLLALFLGTINAVLAARIAVFLVDRHFADTLAAISGVYLLVALENEKSISDPYQKRILLGYLRALRKNLVLLPTAFLYRQLENDELLFTHFKRMEDFVSDRERGLIISKDDTLDEFQKDFPGFVKNLVTGYYGMFEPEQQKGDLALEVSPNLENNLMLKLLRFLVAIFPFIMLGILFLLPEKIMLLGLDTNIVLLISVAWILLVIDASLKLVVVERATSLLKTMNDLR